MKKSLILPAAICASFLADPALAQGSGKNVTILRMSGPRLGVRLAEVDAGAAGRLKLKEEKGALVTEVIANSAAEKAGVLKDDVILKFQGESVLTAAQLARLVREVPAGRKVDLDLVRGGAPLKVTATLEKGDWSSDDAPMLLDKEGKVRDLPFKAVPAPRDFNFRFDGDGAEFFGLPGMRRGRLGITYSEIDGQLARYFKAPTDRAILVNSVVEGSPAEKAGLRAGDLLIKLDGTSIEDTSDLQEAVSDLESGKATPVSVWRDGKSVELSVTIEESRKRRETAPRARTPVS